MGSAGDGIQRLDVIHLRLLPERLDSDFAGERLRGSDFQLRQSTFFSSGDFHRLHAVDLRQRSLHMAGAGTAKDARDLAFIVLHRISGEGLADEDEEECEERFHKIRNAGDRGAGGRGRGVARP